MRSAFPIKTTGVIGPRLALICVPFLTGPLWGQATNVFPSSGSVGIGTTVPAVTLHVQGKTYSSNGFAVAVGDLTSALNGAPWYGLGITNTAMLGSVQAVQLAGWGGLNFQTGGGQVVMKGDNGNVGIGTTAPAYKLSVNGSIQAKEVIVNTGWSDYVFQPHYHLTALKDVAAYIKANHHLPEIPSETEVQQKGAGLGAMQVKLLAKIEELTLYLVQADERNRELQDRVARLEALGFPSAVKVADHRGQHGQLNRGSQKRRRAHLEVSSLGRTEARDDSN